MNQHRKRIASVLELLDPIEAGDGLADCHRSGGKPVQQGWI
jgi:hypothetical protein